MSKTTWILSLFLIINQIVFSQSTIIGRVIDKKTLEPMEYVNIQILKTDSILIAGSYSDREGYFRFDNSLPSGKYLLAYSYLGYERLIRTVDKSSPTLNVGDIALQPNGISLKSVTVSGNSVIKKVDRDLIVPTEAQIKVSTDGLSLLQNMHLPRLIADPVNKKLEAVGGGNVQIRINGVQAELADLSGIRPEDIARIEYHQDPGIRYGNAAAVIDYITKRQDTGGNINANLMNNISDIGSIGFSENNIAAKLNHKKSEFSANTNVWHRNIKWKRENMEQYKYADQTIERLEKGVPTRVENTVLNTKLNYSLVEKDKYFFNAALRYFRNDVPKDFANREGQIYTPQEAEPMDVKSHTKTLSNVPSLDLYYQHNLKNNQLVIFNFVGTYIDSKSTRIYQESRDGEILTDVLSDISGDRYSLIGEGIYEKQFSTSKLTAGLKHVQSYTQNKYWGTTEADVAMNNAETYSYVEFQSKINKFNYTLGVGLSRNYYSQETENKETYIFRPALRMGYNFNNNAYIRLNSYISSDAPSLSDLNDVEQIMDALQIRRGNPNLKTSWHIAGNLSAGYKYKFISTDYYIMYAYNNKPVMSETLFENNYFIQTINNQKSMQRLNSGVNIRVQPWKNYITLSLTPEVNYFRSHGNNYLHNHTNWLLRGSLSANYKNVVLNANFSTNRHTLWGEDLYYGENYHFISAGYKRSQWSLMMGALNLFNKNYDNNNENLSKLTPKYSQVSSRDISPLFFITFTCNINFGRKYDSTSKRINHDDRDTGIMSSGK